MAKAARRGLRRFQQTKQPEPGAHPLIHFLWKEMNAQRVSQEDVAERSGVSSGAMRKWRRGSRSPNLCDVEACLNVLGYEITTRAERA
jgi:transcriptional regulator with XRE-family HTH domain